MEFMEHDLRSYLDNLREPLSLAEIKCVVRQLLSALAYMHERWVMHRDLKTPNILIGNDGRACICDFGLARCVCPAAAAAKPPALNLHAPSCRHYGSPVRKYTQNVVTRWYRCPELLLGSPVYSTGCDVWAMGCIFGELLSNKPLFAGTDEAHQLDAIFYVRVLSCVYVIFVFAHSKPCMEACFVGVGNLAFQALRIMDTVLTAMLVLTHSMTIRSDI